MAWFPLSPSALCRLFLFLLRVLSRRCRCDFFHVTCPSSREGHIRHQYVRTGQGDGDDGAEASLAPGLTSDRGEKHDGFLGSGSCAE